MMAERQLPTRAEPEYYPEGAQRGDEGLVVEINPYREWDDEGGFELVLWRTSGRSGHGVSFQVRHPTIEKARRVARVLYHLLADDYAEQERLNDIRISEMSEQMKIESAERQAREAEEHAARLAKVTPDTLRVELTVCPTCDHAADREEFEQPVYECSRCGGTQVGEGENRCETDNIFMAKVGDLACPSCQEPVEDDPERVVGVEVDGVFIPETEIAGAEA